MSSKQLSGYSPVKSSLKKIFSRLFKARRPFKLTKAGWVFILYTIGVGAGAINTGNNLLYLVFGVFLGLILASGLLSDLSLWRLDVTWSLPDSVMAGEVCLISLCANNQKRRLASFSTIVELHGKIQNEPLIIRGHVPYVGVRAQVNVPIPFLAPRRGEFCIEQVRLVTQYPFGLLKKWWTISPNSSQLTTMIVTPKTFSLSTADLLNSGFAENPVLLTRQKGEGSALYGLRDFRETDNPRRIHWKASAKKMTDEGPSRRPWLVREMEKEREKDVQFVLPAPSELASFDDQKKELLVSFAASLLQEFDQKNQRVRFLFAPGVLGLSRFELKVSPKEGEKNPLAWEFLALWDPGSLLPERLSSFFIPQEEDFEPTDSIFLIESFLRWFKEARL